MAAVPTAATVNVSGFAPPESTTIVEATEIPETLATLMFVSPELAASASVVFVPAAIAPRSQLNETPIPRFSA